MDDADGGILSSIARYVAQDPVRMHMPGHKGRAAREAERYGQRELWQDELHIVQCFERALDGMKPFDVTEVPGLDNLHYPSGPIKRLQDAMAQVFGTEATYCLINGATAGILASLIALRMTAGSGVVAVPRNAHRSIISGLILSGLEPLFVYPQYDESFGYMPLTVDDLRARLDEAESAGILDPAKGKKLCGIVVVNPTYTGVCRDMTGICEYADELGVPVIADEAHGTLFRLSRDLPVSAIEAGASLVIHGAHKTTEAFTQTGLLHVTSKCVRRFPQLACNVREALRLVQSTSPSYILLASLEKAIMNLKRDATWVESMIRTAQQIKRELAGIAGLRVKIPQDAEWDPVKILVDVSGLGLTGPQVRQSLWDNARIVPEMAGPDFVLLMVTGADTPSTVERVVRVFREISHNNLSSIDGCTDARVAQRVRSDGGLWEVLKREPPRPETVMSLAQAFYSRAKDYSLQQSVGRVSCDTVLIYPPGSPVVVPGEKVTAEIAEYLRAAVDCGLEVLGRGHSGCGEELRVYCIEE